MVSGMADGGNGAAAQGGELGAVVVSAVVSR